MTKDEGKGRIRRGSHRLWPSFVAVELAIELAPFSGLSRKNKTVVLGSARPGRSREELKIPYPLRLGERSPSSMSRLKQRLSSSAVLPSTIVPYVLSVMQKSKNAEAGLLCRLGCENRKWGKTRPAKGRSKGQQEWSSCWAGRHDWLWSLLALARDDISVCFPSLSTRTASGTYFLYRLAVLHKPEKIISPLFTDQIIPFIRD